MNKLVLWFLGSIAVLNSVADIWFRIAVGTYTKAIWVNVAVAGTLILTIITLGIGYYVKRLNK